MKVNKDAKKRLKQSIYKEIHISCFNLFKESALGKQAAFSSGKKKLKPFSLKPLLNSRGQIKIQEMAFVLLAVVLLATIVFVFFARVQSEKLISQGELANQERTISLLDKIASMAELNCDEGEICIDEDKINIVKNRQAEFSSLFQGIKEAKIKKVYPLEEEIIFYEKGKANESYSTFISLCKQEKAGYAVEWKCGIALLELGY